MAPATLKTRFAPSPTGLLHLGNVRTALFNYLLARHGGGVFLLRIEDTDATRGEERYERALQEDLRWLGLEWDEGPGRDGGRGPYRQSERQALYQTHFDTLIQRGLAYPCFCTEHELKLARKAQLSAGRPPRYSGRCYGLDPETVRAYRAEGRPATLRFHVPEEAQVRFEDRVRGPQQFSGADMGDFVIRRSDGTPAFFFSNAVDDALMGVSLVLRGEDHLSNTPRQILLLQALGLPVPEYAHMALVVAADGAPLSKRHGSRTVQELREAGFLPGAVVNYLARLGHTYESNAWMPLEALARDFAMDRLHRSPARFDMAQLRHWQKEAVLHGDEDNLWSWMAAARPGDGCRIQDWVPEAARRDFVRTVRDNLTLPGDACVWARRLYAETPDYSHEARQVMAEAGAGFFQAALECLGPGAEDFREYCRAVGERARVKGKALYMPLRAALTGQTTGPEMARLWALLGTERVRRRLQAGVDQLAA